mmetsp:Transcript_22739/g.51258  ORF Transcript_22739/g.51258 Transcript_22739/m.51258 type:complete len:213 (+) Transcript_22739:880-1518(+)
MVPGVLDSGELRGSNGNEGPEGGEDVHDGIGVGSVHVLGLVGLELVGLVLSELTLQSSSKVGERGPAEGKDVDLDTLAFLHAGKPDTADNHKKHHVGQGRLGLNGRNDNANQGGKDRLAGLDNLSKANGSSTHGKNGSAMCSGSEEPDGSKRQPVAGREVGGFPDSWNPQQCTPDHTHHKLCEGDRPMSMDIVASLLVVDVVEGVADVPPCY